MRKLELRAPRSGAGNNQTEGAWFHGQQRADREERCGFIEASAGAVDDLLAVLLR
ncbi:hypothetical protein [Bradyrhizobium sp. BWC-3-1]|uniref:hypothetical protein n=1 Tax=Bradyrhizobium sp. BWC-3-1 TaxID=3080012 RepID=UPI00293E8647|nr:hypothetical protein [Bradyrhizobium sp. BWC-3-1]WOH60283.1 hypothetical protein RX329_09350 [Bradyrhizobium sp. BWC-3-1]